MNILWIMVDQMRGDCAGFAGHPLVRTPHLDALASRSVVFDRAFTQSPLCGPSRVCLFTGKYVSDHGVWWNGVPLPPDETLLPALLRDAGYQTAIIGKLHFAPPGLSYGFDHAELHEELLLDELGLDAYDRFLAERNPPAQGPSPSTQWTNPVSGVGICHMPEELEETRWVADRTCAFLRERVASPFFLFASFIRPHSPYNPLPRFAEPYTDADIAPPPFIPQEWDRVPPRVRATAESWGWDALQPHDFAEVRRHYYGLCSQIDESVGRILKCLQEQGLADDTVVVFGSDHGDFLGEHGLLFKEHLYEGSLHVPLIIHDPRSNGRPARCNSLTETVDIMPTLLELADLPAPPGLRGRSLCPALADPQHQHRSHVFGEWTTHCVNARVREVLDACTETHTAYVRTDRWKYIHYIGEPGELYDLEADPDERDNLYTETGLSAVKDEMEALLPDGLKTSQTLPPPGSDNPYLKEKLTTTTDS